MGKVLAGQYISDEIYSAGHFNELGIVLLEVLSRLIIVELLSWFV